MTEPAHSLDYLIEDLMELDSYLAKRMFGCKAVYLHGLMILVMADSEAPWRGLLFPVDFADHESLLTEFDCLQKHPILKKWLHLSCDSENFEVNAQQLIRAIKRADPRFGITPKERAKTKNKKKKSK